VGHALPNGGRELATRLDARHSVLRVHFPNDDAATKLIWLALRNISAAWSRSSPAWRPAMNQFAILYGDRFTQPPI
jgi:transposase-like protein